MNELININTYNEFKSALDTELQNQAEDSSEQVTC